MADPAMPLPPDTVVDPPRALPERTPVWLPWLFAPVFLFLPIGGCGVAAAIRRQAEAVPAVASEPPLPGPVATVATVTRPRN
jgi:hypothetical protein